MTLGGWAQWAGLLRVVLAGVGQLRSAGSLAGAGPHAYVSGTFPRVAAVARYGWAPFWAGWLDFLYPTLAPREPNQRLPAFLTASPRRVTAHYCYILLVRARQSASPGAGGGESTLLILGGTGELPSLTIHHVPQVGTGTVPGTEQISTNIS